MFAPPLEIIHEILAKIVYNSWEEGLPWTRPTALFFVGGFGNSSLTYKNVVAVAVTGTAVAGAASGARRASGQGGSQEAQRGGFRLSKKRL